MDQPIEKKPSKSFTDILRARFKGVLEPIAGFFNRLGITPNEITLIGLAGHLGAGVLAALGEFTWSGVVLIAMAPLDALDGTMARLRGQSSRFGGFLDSVVDRYAEVVLLGGLLVFYVLNGQVLPTVLAFLATSGSVMVSYTKARGEALGFKLNVGLLTRVERYLVIIPCLLLAVPQIMLWILAIFTHFTALQRIFSVRKQAAEMDDLIK